MEDAPIDDLKTMLAQLKVEYDEIYEENIELQQ